MSTIVGTNIEVTNIKYDSDTTSMIISNAGQVTIQGEGTATTNLQQGLSKHWAYVNMATPVIHDSLNASSVDDTSAGRFNMNITSAFTNVNYAVNFSSNTYAGDTWSTVNAEQVKCNWNVTNTSTKYDFTSYNGAYTDAWHNYLDGHGDLA